MKFSRSLFFLTQLHTRPPNQLENDFNLALKFQSRFYSDTVCVSALDFALGIQVVLSLAE